MNQLNTSIAHPEQSGIMRPLGREPGVEYWRVERVARFLDVSRKRVYQLIQERQLQAIRLGPRQLRVLRQSIDEYIGMLLASEECGHDGDSENEEME